MKEQELLGKIEKIIKEQPLPEEIKKSVNEIYLDYHDAYHRLLSNIGRIVEKDEKLRTELNNIVSYTNKDYEEDKNASFEIEETSYFIKLEKLAENVRSVMNNIMSNKQNSNKETLPPILDIEEETSKERKTQLEQDETIQKYAKTDLENKECAKQITASVLSEIDSSKEALIMKLSNIKNASSEEEIRYRQGEFLKEIELIKNKAKLKLPLEIEEILRVQEDIISNRIVDIYDQYREDEKNLNSREKFATTLHAQVDEEEAMKKLQEKGDYEIPSLPGDIIKE